MKFKFALKILPVILLLVSCTTSKNDTLIIGNWHGTTWLIDGNPSNRNVESTYFTFDKNGSYTYIYSGTTEKGKYKIENDMLFTTPAGEQEMMVKITKLTNDSLVFDMNRNGQSETLTLLRK